MISQNTYRNVSRNSAPFTEKSWLTTHVLSLFRWRGPQVRSSTSHLVPETQRNRVCWAQRVRPCWPARSERGALSSSTPAEPNQPISSWDPRGGGTKNHLYTQQNSGWRFEPPIGPWDCCRVLKTLVVPHATSPPTVFVSAQLLVKKNDNMTHESVIHFLDSVLHQTCWRPRGELGETRLGDAEFHLNPPTVGTTVWNRCQTCSDCFGAGNKHYWAKREHDWIRVST